LTPADEEQVLLTTLNVLPGMKARGRGCIINLASRAGNVTVPYLAGYSISKASVIKATENIQKDLDADGLGDKIQLYCCHPGAVLTRLSLRSSPPLF
jgi:short-subunit dehydrogenase